MLRQIDGGGNRLLREEWDRAAEVTMAEASYPAPFPSQLEFNPASHGTWNIVHIGMNVPECRQIYVCAVNCMRGVVLTAAEMKEQDRFSFVLLKEEDLLEGTVEDITIEGTADVLERLPELPPAVLLFTVCTHHFLGCDLNRIYRELERRFPTVDFLRGYMDPIMQKESPTPDLKLRRDMYASVPEQDTEIGTAALLGHNVSLEDTCDLMELFRIHGRKLVQMTETKTYREYKALGRAELFLSCVPNGATAIAVIGRRLGRKSLYLPMTFSYGELEEQYRKLVETWGENSGADHEHDLNLWHQTRRTQCEQAAAETLQAIGDAPIFIDYTVHPRPLGLARYLLERGFRVEKIYLNGISPEEREAYCWLKEHAPDLILASSILPVCRVKTRGDGRRVLAVGQQAAWFQRTPYFVNMVEGGGLQGYDGICRLMEMMREAWSEPKDTEDLVPRKGLGCESCV